MHQHNPVKWGILACGTIAQAFARALKETKGNELHAVSARESDRAQAFAEAHGATRAYGSYDAMLADSEVEAVYIATLHPFHLEWIARSVHAGKHVFCEKPLTMNLREARRAQKLASGKRCLLREAFMYRHHPQTQTIVDLVESGVIGQVRLIDAQFGYDSGLAPDSRSQAKALGGGAILDVGCYPLSLARLIAGRARGRLFAEPIELKAVGHLDAATRTDMWTTASLRFEGDILATCTTAVRMQAANQARIYGETGHITVKDPWFCNDEIQVDHYDERETEIMSAAGERNLYSYEIESFAGELRGRPIGPRAPGMRLEDTLGNMQALDRWRAEIGLGYEADRLQV